MTDFEAIDALLAGARQEVPLPPVEERRALREGLNLSRTQVAQALSVSPSTVGGWESGRDPSGEVRAKYAYFLDGARTRLAAIAGEEAAANETDAADAPDGPEEADTVHPPGQDEDGQDDVEALAVPQPCVLCGQPAAHQVAGFPQHLDPAACGTADSGRMTEPADKAAPAWTDERTRTAAALETAAPAETMAAARTTAPPQPAAPMPTAESAETAEAVAPQRPRHRPARPGQEGAAGREDAARR
ncbi:helix-turn-helix transcriptional regulator, partial [Streptomyces sp. SID10815]|uniref:helix-turn-helix domain-containing protein n=1 Tax=Streptomyces sp. SID10815 TaxID=2706027 RepID=UPI0013CAE9E3